MQTLLTSLEALFAHVPTNMELGFLISTCVMINLVFLIIIRRSMKIVWLRIFFLFFLGITLFFIIKFLQIFQGGEKVFDTFFFRITVGVNPFIESFTHGLESNIQSATGNLPVNIGINTLAAVMEEIGKILMFSLFVIYHKQPAIRSLIGFILWVLLFQAIYTLRNVFGIDAEWEIVSGKVFSVLLYIVAIVYHLKSRKENVITNIAGSIYYMLIIALGFAFIENIAYITDAIYRPDGPSLLIMFVHSLIRISVGSISHIFFSLIFVFFYSQGVFGSIALIDRKSTKKIRSSFWWLKMLGVWKKTSFHTAYLIEKTVQGGALSIILHTVYNSLYAYSDAVGDSRFALFAILLVLVGSISFFLYVIGESKNRAHYSLIQDKIKLGKKIREIQKH